MLKKCYDFGVTDFTILIISFKEAGQKLASEYKKTSISAVGATRFPMSWFIIIKKQLESHDYV